MRYQEPPPALSDASFVGINNGKAVWRGKQNIDLEVHHIVDVGWCMELRLDRSDPAVLRQPHTGMQDSLPLSSLHREGENHSALCAENERLVLDAQGGVLLLSDDSPVLASEGPAFFLHPKDILLYEGLMSLKVTDFAKRAPFAPEADTFASRMVRFQYHCPSKVILGLPGSLGEYNRHGYRFELYNTDQPFHLPDRRPLYQSWPILLHRGENGNGWVAVFFDNPSRTFVDTGDFFPQKVTFESVTGNARVYIISGATLPDLTKKLMTLLGLPVFPPLFAFGYQQCRWSYMSTTDVRRVAHTLREHNIPCDSLYFDIDHMDDFRVFTHDAQNFADLRSCNNDLHTKGFKTICIVDPGIKKDPSYPVYEALLTSQRVVTLPDHSPLHITCWPGTSVLPDFFDAGTRAFWANVQAHWMTDNGFDGVWNDMNEPSNFDGMNSTTDQGNTAIGPLRSVHNLYGYSMAQASSMGIDRIAPGKRHLVITRSGYPGVQRYAVIWHGDNHAWWEHLRLAIDTCIHYALVGVPYTGPDVPGFTGNPPDDLAVRFFQLGSWLPLFRGHSIYFAKDKEPYAFGPRATLLIRQAITQRYSLLREWYSGFAHAVEEKRPVLQPVFDAEDHLIHSQFLLFDKFLVAPIVERDQARRLLYLPEGEWYALGKSTKRLQGARWKTIRVTDATVPVFVRAGSIVVRNTVGKNTEETFRLPEREELYLDGHSSARGYWYSDDGETENDPRAKRQLLTWQKGHLTREQQ